MSKANCVKLLILTLFYFSVLLAASKDTTHKGFVIKALEDSESNENRKAGDRWGLIVGVEKYDDPEINSLHYSVDDVQALYDFLTNSDKGRFFPEKVKLMIDTAQDKRLKPTKANILHYLNEWLAPRVKTEDTVLVFFSGHGMVYGNRKYLLPLDTEILSTHRLTLSIMMNLLKLSSKLSGIAKFKLKRPKRRSNLTQSVAKPKVDRVKLEEVIV